MIIITENLGISDSISITETNADGTEEKFESQSEQVQQANENPCAGYLAHLSEKLVVF